MPRKIQTSKKIRKKHQNLKEKAQNLPTVSGVYLMRGEAREILYIGKAKSLKSRVQSYFSDTSIKTDFLMKKTKDIDFIVTSTEVEAYLLEASLIKRHQPRYNIRLKDDKSYPYIFCSLKHDFPKFELSRKVSRGPKRVYFGPYTSGTLVKDIITLLNQVFKIRDCSDKSMKNRDRPCLTHQMGHCKAPCVGYISKREYGEDFKKALLFLKGKNKKILQTLEEKMLEASRNQRFEEAKILRDRLRAVDLIWQKQSIIKNDDTEGKDFFHYFMDDRGVLVEALFVRGGRVTGNRSFFFPKSSDNFKDDLEGFFSSFLSQYYTDNLIPDQIKVPTFLKEDLLDLLRKAFFSLKKAPVSVETISESRNALMKMTHENAKTHFEKKFSLYESQTKALLEIQKKLHLPKFPHRMECYDISHLQGEITVASCVVFEQGEPKKREYRKYKISTNGKADDYASMKEVLTRRFSKDSVDPDLIVVDGGKGQLAVALEVLKNMGKEEIPVVGLAKSRVKGDFSGKEIDRSEERFFLPKRQNPVVFRASSLSFRILVQLRNEAHRLAIGFHRKLRTKESLSSYLDQIYGLGEKRKKILLERFGSLENMKKATVAQIESLPFFHKKLSEEVLKKIKQR